MIRIGAVLILIFILVPYFSEAQTFQLIATSDEFILENVKGYSSVEERNIEHEEYNVLVFREKDIELSFYFTFFRGEKVCSYIKKVAPISELKEEITSIKTELNRAGNNQWQNAEKTVHVEIAEVNGLGMIITKWLR